MIEVRKEECTQFETTFAYPVDRKKCGCTIFLGYTSNLVTSGLREVRFLWNIKARSTDEFYDCKNY